MMHTVENGPSAERKTRLTAKKEPSMRTKKDAALIVQRLKEAYPLALCSLDYASAWQLLVSVRLSAQCTDARVNVVTKELFTRYPTLEALAGAGAEAIEAVVKPCGLGRSKARDLAAMSRMLIDEYGGQVPQAMEDLLRLPGVGRKSANLIRGDIFHLPAVVADTHLHPHGRAAGLCDGLHGPREGGKSPCESAAAGGEQRFLPPVRAARPGGVYRAQSEMRSVLPAGPVPHRPPGRRARKHPGAVKAAGARPGVSPAADGRNRAAPA